MSLKMSFSCYRQPTKLWEGNVFTGVCHSVHRGWGNTYSAGIHTCYCPQRSWGKVIFSEACVKNSVHGGGACMTRGGMCGRGACMAGRHAWQIP